jgi:rRNA maturation endonuclease Nob1
MGGGIMSDALDEVGVVKKFEQKIDAPPQIKVRCRGCQALNDETAKFCSQCGAGM